MASDRDKKRGWTRERMRQWIIGGGLGLALLIVAGVFIAGAGTETETTAVGETAAPAAPVPASEDAAPAAATPAASPAAPEEDTKTAPVTEAVAAPASPTVTSAPAKLPRLPCCSFSDFGSPMELPLDFLPTAGEVTDGLTCIDIGGDPALQAERVAKNRPDFSALMDRNETCASSTYLLSPYEHGFFAMTHSLALALSAMMELGAEQARFLPLQSWVDAACPAGDIGCFYESFTASCKPTVIRGYRLQDVMASYKHLQNTTFPGIEPASFDKFRWVARVMSSIMQPSKALEEALAAAKADLGWDALLAGETVLGMHLRAGDSCSEHLALNEEYAVRACDDLEGYMDSVRRVANRYNIKHIYLATDGGDSVYDQTTQFPEFTWHFRRHPSPPPDAPTEDGFHQGLDVLVDAMLVAECDAIVGKFTANLDRAVLELAAGNRECLPPFSSLDANWCFNWGMQHGRQGLVRRGQYEGHRFHC